MESTDSITISNTGASTNGAATTLKGGVYEFSGVATFGTSGALTLQQQGPDGATWISVPLAPGSANTGISNTQAELNTNTGCIVMLAPGQYRITTGVNTTAAYASVVRIPV